MNTKEAIKSLESNGLKVYHDGTPEQDTALNLHFFPDKQREEELKGKKLFRVWRGNFFYGVYTGRELIRLAENWNNLGRGTKQFIKDKRKSKSRRKTRDAISTRNFDDIPFIREEKDDDISHWY